MRQKRAKAYRKLMQLYSMSFGFRQPYQVLVDSEMCKESVTHKIDLVKQLHSVLQGDVKPMITQCCIHELYLQGKAQQAAVYIAKTFERRMCNHREAIPGEECLQSVIGSENKHRYVVASQSQPLRAKLRAIPATPLVHLTRSVMVLEPPSDNTLKAKERAEEGRLHATVPELASVGPLAKSTSEPPKKKHKGPKGPNPLSMKKKKAQPVQITPKSSIKLQVAPPIDSTVVGRKRKAEEDDTDSETEESNAKPTTESASKKRRKRRKKLKGETPLNSEI